MRVYCTKVRQLVSIPRDEQLNIYVCGVTPYDSMHVGHIAMLLTYDVLARRMEDLGSRVRMVRNITDVDDPLLPKALELGVPYWDLVETEIAQFGRDERALEMRRAEVEPRASEHLDGIVDMVEELLESGHAYRLDGHVYFSVDNDPGYGSLSGNSKEQMIELSRENGGDPDRSGKKNPLDFILWQPSREGEPEYQTRLPNGRPGWHIGCSVMSRKYLGERIDIHGGGEDLVFPHHECELAQNRCVSGGSDVSIWLHAGFVGYQGYKMSKSRGNIVLARDVLHSHDPRVLRLAVLTHYHHRYGVEWRDEFLPEATQLLRGLVDAAAVVRGPDLTELSERFLEHLDDDLDFPGAVQMLTQCADAARLGGDYLQTSVQLRRLAGLLGLDLDRPVLGG